jgi:hypothetical protein
VPSNAEEHPPFASYTQALKHLLRGLADPKVGPQWVQRRHDDEAPEPELGNVPRERRATPDVPLSITALK